MLGKMESFRKQAPELQLALLASGSRGNLGVDFEVRIAGKYKAGRPKIGGPRKP
jgi:hypothetical protein